MSIGITDREKRALEQYLTVTPEIGRARNADGLAIVTSQSGQEYLVDFLNGRCQRKDGSLCPDQQYNLNDNQHCKHVIRAQFAVGARPLTETTLKQVDADPQLGEHADGPVIL